MKSYRCSPLLVKTEKPEFVILWEGGGGKSAPVNDLILLWGSEVADSRSCCSWPRREDYCSLPKVTELIGDSLTLSVEWLMLSRKLQEE